MSCNRVVYCCGACLVCELCSIVVCVSYVVLWCEWVFICELCSVVVCVSYVVLWCEWVFICELCCAGGELYSVMLCVSYVVLWCVCCVWVLWCEGVSMSLCVLHCGVQVLLYISSVVYVIYESVRWCVCVHLCEHSYYVCTKVLWMHHICFVFPIVYCTQASSFTK